MKIKNKNGYTLIASGDHPRAYNGLVPEHVLVMEDYIGRPLPKGTVVHHRNQIREDNRIKNLLLLRNHADHWVLHQAMKRQDTAFVKAIEDWSLGFMTKLKSGLSEIECFLGISKITEEAQANLDVYVVRKNRMSGKLFIEFEEEFLISPDGKTVEIDDERFDDPEEVIASGLSEKQLLIYQNLVLDRQSNAIKEKEISNFQRKLFNELKKLRRKIAAQKNIPVYYIFDNETLKQMSEIMPITESSMLLVSGVGPAKLQWYGGYFIDTIKRFKEANGIN